MRPITLKIKGLNSFMEEQEIDFRKLTSMGLFGIFGQTGSGKSSILDGITLSLYGKISRGNGEFLNKNMDVLKVSFEFSLSGEKYQVFRVEREMKRNNSGDIRTTYARILEIDNEEETILEDKVNAVNKRCEEIIGLSAEDFSRTVVLPQGKFSEFLKLQNAPRREMLERIFNLEAFGAELSSKVARRAAGYKAKYSELGGQLMGYEQLSEAFVKEKQEALVQSQVDVNAGVLELEALQKQYEEAKMVWQLQNQKNQAEALLVKHLEASQEMDLKMASLDLAERSERVKPYWLALEKTVNDLSEAIKQVETAKLNVQSSLTLQKEAKSTFDLAKANREQKGPMLRIKENQLMEADQAIKKLLADEAELIKLQEDLAVLQANFEKERSLLEKRQENYQQKLSQAEKIEEKIESLTLSEQYKEQVRSAAQLKRKWMESQVFSERKREQLEILKGKLSLSKNQIELAEKDKDLEAEAIETIKANMLKLDQTAPGTREQLLSQTKAVLELKNQWELHRRLSQEVSQLNERMGGYLISLREYKDKLLDLDQQLEQATKELNEAESREIASNLRHMLVAGCPCPVCGALEHPMGQEIQQAVDQDQYEGLLHRLRVLKRDLEASKQQLNQEIAVLESKCTDAQVQVGYCSEQLASLGTAFLKTLPEEASTALERFEADLAAYEAEKALLESQIKNRETKFNENQQKLAVLQNEQQMTNSQIQEVQSELNEQMQLATAHHEAYLETLGTLEPDHLEDLLNQITEQAKASEELNGTLRAIKVSFKSDLAAIDAYTKQVQQTEQKISQLEASYAAKNVSSKELRSQLTEKFGPLDLAAEQLVSVQKELAEIEEAFRAAEEVLLAADQLVTTHNQSFAFAKATADTFTEQERQQQSMLMSKLSEFNFDHVDQAKSHAWTEIQREEAKTLLAAYASKKDQLKGAIEAAMNQLEGRVLSEEAWKAISSHFNEQTQQVEALKLAHNALLLEVKRLEEQLVELGQILKEKEAVEKMLGQLADLSKLFEARKFVAFIASSQLQYISGKASEQLMEITSGNYALEADLEGNFLIRDYKNGGVTREASTLSGGETFLVSLSLALALSAQIQLKGRAPLELFFLDEGFGTLDDDTLEVVMNALENLHHDKLSIGLISHVESIKNRVPIKLLVSPAKSGMGGSKVKIELS